MTGRPAQAPAERPGGEASMPGDPELFPPSDYTLEKRNSR